MKNHCKLKLNISNLAKGFSVDEKFFKEIAKKTLKIIDLSADSCVNGSLEIDLALVGEAEMKKINKEWRRKNEPTDVLSFSDMDIPQGRLAKDFDLQISNKNKKIIKKRKGNASIESNLLQIIICPSYAKKQAKKFKYSQKQELAMLMAHGILHVLGYDHERSMGEHDAMWFVQDEILKKSDK